MGKCWDERTKVNAKDMWMQGVPFTKIANKLDVSKSTLHYWLRGLDHPEKLTKLGKQKYGYLLRYNNERGMAKKRRRELTKITLEVSKEVDCYHKLFSSDYYKSMLAVLYWAEGNKAKGNTRRAPLGFTNTNPKICKLFVELLRECYSVDESRFKVHLYLHYYHNQERTRQYWSNLLRIPENQFAKIRLKRRSRNRFRANHYGICSIRYPSVDLQYRITTTAERLHNHIIKSLRL